MQQRGDEESKKKKTISLKAITSTVSDEDSEKSEHEEVEDNDMVLLAHKFRKFFKKKDPPIRGKNSFRKFLDRIKEKEKDRDERKKRSSICFGCNRSGHLRIDCSLEKKMLRKKKKALLAVWDDSDISSSKEK